jgi:dihydropyrimidinase
MNPILITNGTVIHVDSSQVSDILISDDKISEIGKLNADQYPNAKIIEASGKLIFPGGIDPHVHLALPTPAGNSSDDFISGSRAAIAGGTTCFIDFVTPGRNQSLIEALHRRKTEASSSFCDYSLHMGISGWNPGTTAQVEGCIEKEGVQSFKAYLAYRESIGIDYAQLEELMRCMAPYDKTVLVHCEDGEIISQLQQSFIKNGQTHASYHVRSHPPEAEIRAVDKVIEIAARTNCTAYIVHVSTAGAAQSIRQAKASGIKVFAETCPQYLMLNDSVYDANLPNKKVLPYIISPPLRNSYNQLRLWQGLSDGIFDAVATDHCPFNLHGQKDHGIEDFTKIPNGAGGIEHRLTLLYTYGVLTAKITINQFVNLTSTQPAEIFGFGNQKGKLKPGFDADIVIWDPDAKGIISVNNHSQNCDSEIYEGKAIHGKPNVVLVNGKIAFRDGELVTGGLKGKYLG